MAADERLVQAANAIDLSALFSGCKTSLDFSPSISSTVYDLKTLPPDLLDWALNLVKSNLYDQYVAAKDTGWSSSDKLGEMTEENARYVIATETTSDGSTARVGFLYFQFTMEDTCDPEGEEADADSGSEEERQIPVVYCYELQLEEAYQRRGLGTYFMNLLEELGLKYQMKKSMLTVFKSNTSAIAFYTNRGYDIDGISPSNHLPPRRAARISYEIFSKSL
ncbi:hypothetical protein BDZ88DRAFT_413180 [Geranomyces variabilis]|nr:hypothetical protein BDZ88DRAFT_413180 [Geranomyces variabilis]KAJ3136810.1 N-alpha-acetyltransferase 40 [Geranomyces variabilis]